SGCILDVAEVLRHLSIAKATKDLSVIERRLLDTTLEQFVSEAALACSRTEEDIAAELDAIFGA
ncbi:CarD family transcriptional regulator, partial [Myxococcota bacterium]